MISFLTELPSGKPYQLNIMFKKAVVTALNETHAGPLEKKRLHALERLRFTMSLSTVVFFQWEPPKKKQNISCWKQDSAEQLRAKSFQCVQQRSVLEDKGRRVPSGNTPISSIRWCCFIYRLRVNKTLDCPRFVLCNSNVALGSKENHNFCTSGDVYRACNGVLTERFLWGTWSSPLSFKLWKMLQLPFRIMAPECSDRKTQVSEAERLKSTMTQWRFYGYSS